MHPQQQPATNDGGGETSAATRFNTNLPPSSFLRRRNSIATSVVVPTKTAKNFHAYSFPANGRSPPAAASIDFDLNSYTSLKDILPPPVAAAPALEVCGSSSANSRSSMLKQAAWAYLHQTSSSPRSSGADGFIRRLWLRFSAPVNACLGFISRAVDRILRTVQLVRSTR